MNNTNITKENKIRFVSAIIMLIGIIIAFCSKEIELIDTTLLDGDSGTTPIGILGHVIVISLFVILSDTFLFFANKNDANCNIPVDKVKAFHILYAFTGVCFAIASGCSERSSHLSDAYSGILAEPLWYNYDIITMEGFDNIPNVIESISNAATLFYLITVTGIITLIIIACGVDKVKESGSNLISIVKKHASNAMSTVNNNVTPTNDGISSEQIKKPQTDSIDTNNQNSISYIEELKQLKELLDSGVITKEEFEDRKNHLLNK